MKTHVLPWFIVFDRCERVFESWRDGILGSARVQRKRIHAGLRRLHHQRSHIGEHQARVERAGAVNVADVAGAIDEEDPQGVIQWAGWVERVFLFVHGLAVGGEDGLEFRLRRRGDEVPRRGRRARGCES